MILKLNVLLKKGGTEVKIKVSDYKFGIFDLDGTLLDSKRLVRKIVAEKMYKNLVSRKNQEDPYGRLFPAWFWRKGTKDFFSLVERKILELIDILDCRVQLFTGVYETLVKLRAGGVKLFASTSSINGKKRLQKAGIDDFFEEIIGADLMPKKHHIPYIAITSGIPLRKFSKQAFLVGDGPYDLFLAQKYGVYGIGITNTLPPDVLFRVGAKEVISNLRELIKAPFSFFT